jgi:hypothetical protein
LPIGVEIHEGHSHEHEDEAVRDEREKAPVFFHDLFDLGADFVPPVISEHQCGGDRRDDSRSRYEEVVHDLGEKERRVGEGERKRYFQMFFVADFLNDLRKNDSDRRSEKYSHADHRNEGDGCQDDSLEISQNPAHRCERRFEEAQGFPMFDSRQCL